MRGETGVYAVVPAAGRGSRLGVDTPKIFVPLLPDLTIWDTLHTTLRQVAERTVLVLSPQGQTFIESHASAFRADAFAGTALATQLEPLGMGDAIFGAASEWQVARTLLIVWGDQFNLSPATLKRCLDLHAVQSAPALVLPLARMPKPYVEYVFDEQDRLARVQQSREGDSCASGGWADIGAFVLTAGSELLAAWDSFRATHVAGARTGEINFLPFLVHLSQSGWPVLRHEVTDLTEGLGINTPDELATARGILAARDSGTIRL